MSKTRFSRKRLAHKWKLAKWGAKIVNFLGFQKISETRMERLQGQEES